MLYTCRTQIHAHLRENIFAYYSPTIDHVERESNKVEHKSNIKKTMFVKIVLSRIYLCLGKFPVVVNKDGNTEFWFTFKLNNIEFQNIPTNADYKSNKVVKTNRSKSYLSNLVFYHSTFHLYTGIYVVLNKQKTFCNISLVRKREDT